MKKTGQIYTVASKSDDWPLSLESLVRSDVFQDSSPIPMIKEHEVSQTNQYYNGRIVSKVRQGATREVFAKATHLAKGQISVDVNMFQ